MKRSVWTPSMVKARRKERSTKNIREMFSNNSVFDSLDKYVGMDYHSIALC